MTDTTVETTLLDTLRDILLNQRTGVLEMAAEGSGRRLYFVRGLLHLSERHPLAKQVAGLLEGEHDFGTREVSLVQNLETVEVGALWPPRARQALRELLSRIARFLVQWRDQPGRFAEGEAGLPGPLVGPLPTVDLLMELAVVERTDDDLLGFLGGEKVRWLVDGGQAQPDELWLEPMEGFLLSRLEEPMTAADLVRQVGSPRRQVLEDLCRLRSLHLIAPADQVRNRGKKTTGTTITVSMRDRFLERIGQDLESRPFDLEPAEHRAQLAELLRQLGDLDHYQLLQVEPSATVDEIHIAYELRARLVHPSHAERIGLQGRENVLELLFERATEGYAILSDPDRRSAYNRENDITSFPEEEAVDRRERDRELAQEHFETARRRFGKEDYHNAYVLIRESLRLDPRAEYYALLGQVEMKNPNWQRYAIDTLRKAVDLAPESIQYRYLLADACEKVGMLEEAKLNYEAILEEQPSHPGAQDGLRRLGGKAPGDGKKGLLGRLFGKD